jgi:hypothetical protein
MVQERHGILNAQPVLLLMTGVVQEDIKINGTATKEWIAQLPAQQVEHLITKQGVAPGILHEAKNT